MPTITYDELLASFDDMLDDCYPFTRIGDAKFFPSQVLKKCDPTEYRLGAIAHAELLAENAGILVEGVTTITTNNA
jgi:hypothetical protein